MAEVSAKSFLGLLQKSGLCDQAELKATINELFKKVNGSSIKLDQLTNHLLEQGLISEWHLKKLLAGKYKGFFLGKYKLLRHLGTGGMSTVYLAQHTIFNQQRAIKVLPRDRVADKSYLERFYREGRAAAALNHRNIVRVYDIGNEGDTHYLVMEYVKGEDIYEKVKRDGPLAFDKAVDYTVQALTGLQHAHENDLVHRDIKPANLLVTPDGDVKILDLGLALFQEEDASLTVMNSERVLGTADYLSPEQAVDSHNVDRRSDIYSAGCTLYFMLTGKPPFHEGSIAQRIAKHQSCEPDDVRSFREDCPDDLLDVVNKMMKKNPDDRFQNCQGLATCLRGIGDGLLMGPPRVATGRKTKKDSVGAGKVVSKKPEPQLVAAAAEPVARQKPVQDKKSSSQKTPPAVSGKASAQKTDKRDSRRQTGGPAPPVKEQPAKRSPAKPSAAPPEKKVSAKDRKPVPPKPAKPAAPKPAAPKPVATKPTEPSSQKTKPGKEEGATANPSDTVNFGRRPKVDAADVSVIVSSEATSKGDVSEKELRSFAAQNRTTRKQSVKPKRNPVKDQLLIVGLVIGMLLLLGLVLIVAMNFVGVKEKDAFRPVESSSVEVLCSNFDDSSFKNGYDIRGRVT